MRRRGAGRRSPCRSPARSPRSSRTRLTTAGSRAPGSPGFVADVQLARARRATPGRRVERHRLPASCRYSRRDSSTKRPAQRAAPSTRSVAASDELVVRGQQLLVGVLVAAVAREVEQVRPAASPTLLARRRPRSAGPAARRRCNPTQNSSVSGTPCGKSLEVGVVLDVVADPLADRLQDRLPGVAHGRRMHREQMLEQRARAGVADRQQRDVERPRGGGAVTRRAVDARHPQRLRDQRLAQQHAGHHRAGRRRGQPVRPVRVSARVGLAPPVA